MTPPPIPEEERGKEGGKPSLEDRGRAPRGLESATRGGVDQRGKTRAPSPADTPQTKTTSDYVDAYKEVVYNIFETPDGKNLSKTLHVYYYDGVHLAISIDDISNDVTFKLVKGEEFFYVGKGSKVFPKYLSRGTTPNLWDAKRTALIAMSDYFTEIVFWALVAIQFVLPPATAGLPWTIRYGVRSTGKSTGARPDPNVVENGVERLRRKIGGPSVKEEVQPPPKSGKIPETQSKQPGASKQKPASQTEPVERPVTLARKFLEDALDAQREADYYWAQLGRSSAKTVATSGGTPAVSGHSPRRAYIHGGAETTAEPNFPQRTAPSGESEPNFFVRRYEELSGKSPPSGQDGGIRGSEAASHAEIKERIFQFDDKMNKPTGISHDMCGNCRSWYRHTAKQQKADIISSDPSYIRAFRSDGAVDIYDLNGNHLRTVPSDVQPSAGVKQGYIGVEW